MSLSDVSHTSSTTTSAQNIRRKMQDHKQSIDDFLNSNMESLFNQFVIPEIKRMASAMFLPDAFIEGIAFVKGGNNAGSVVNTFGGADLPLARWFNYGTKRNYLIEPKVTQPFGSVRADRDKDDVGKNSTDKKQVVHPSVLHWKGAGGENVFARRVIHPGFPKTLAMEFGLAQGIKILEKQLPEILKREQGNVLEVKA